MTKADAHRGSVGAALSLVLLAPVIGEMLSGSTPLFVFLLAPGIAAFEIALYGGGALVVRELVVRSGGGWASVLILGLAYGLIEEGVVLKAMFDPAWPGAGALGEYGRVGGIGWIWTLLVVPFHAVASITIPILLVGLMFQDLRGPWLGRHLFVGLVVLWSCAIVAAAAVVRREYAVQPEYTLVCVAALALILLARAVPASAARPSAGERGRIAFFAVAAFATCAFFIFSWSGPETHVPSWATIALQSGVLGATALWLHRRTRSRSLSDAQRVALASGVLSPFVGLALLRLSDGGALVGVAMIVGLSILWRRTTRRSLAGASSP